MKHVVMFSGGISSWAAGRRVVDQHGPNDVVLLFADTLIEDPDTYRFLDDAAADLGVPLTRIADGRDPWQCFIDVSYLGNTRIDPCSRILKREIMRKWIEEHCDPADTVVVIGYHWQEEHRWPRLEKLFQPWRVWAPLREPPYTFKDHWFADCRARGFEPPELYAYGFEHNNCGGACVKAGQGQWHLLLNTFPERYAYAEAREEQVRQHLDKDVAILRDRRGGDTKPLTLRAFRERIEAGDLEQLDLFDWGGCSCLLPAEAA